MESCVYTSIYLSTTFSILFLTYFGSYLYDICSPLLSTLACGWVAGGSIWPLALGICFLCNDSETALHVWGWIMIYMQNATLYAKNFWTWSWVADEFINLSPSFDYVLLTKRKLKRALLVDSMFLLYHTWWWKLS